MQDELSAGASVVEAFTTDLPELWRAVGDHLWQSTLFVLVLVPAALLLKRAPARLRYTLSLVASLKFALPAALLLPLLLRFFPGASESVSALPGLPEMLSGWITHWPGFGWVENTLGSTPGIALLLTLVWLSGAALSLGHWWLRTRAFARRVEASEEVAAGPLYETFSALHTRLELRQPVRLILMRGDFEPGVFGVRRPVVVLPEDMPARLTPAELEAVLLHELTHIRRRDNLVASLHMGLCALFWFYPLVWWLDRRLLAEREEACDEQVLASGGAAKAYARGLLKAAGLGAAPQPAGVSTASAADFRLRIERILASRHQPRASWSHRLALASTLPMLVWFSVTTAQRSVRDSGEPQVVSAEPAALPISPSFAAIVSGKPCALNRSESPRPPSAPQVATKPSPCPKGSAGRLSKPAPSPERERLMVAERPRLERRPSRSELDVEITETAEPAQPAQPAYLHRN